MRCKQAEAKEAKEEAAEAEEKAKDEALVEGSSRHLADSDSSMPRASADKFGDRTKLRPHDFNFHAVLGEGAYGRVYLATHKGERTGHQAKKPLEPLAVKVLAMAHVIDQEQVSHVHDEIRILAQCQHRNIVQLYCHFMHLAVPRERHFPGDKIYMVMEFANGGEMYSLIQNEGKLTESAARHYTAQITLAMAYLHQQLFVYRDLKPENVLFSRSGHVRITDFGLTKRCHDRTWTMCGTPDYIAPEILRNSGHGKGVDYWALGCVLFEMLTGLPPFHDPEGNLTVSWVLGHRPGRAFPVRLHNGGVISEEARSLVEGLLQPDVSKRLGCGHNGAKAIEQHSWFQSKSDFVRGGVPNQNQNHARSSPAIILHSQDLLRRPC